MIIPFSLGLLLTFGLIVVSSWTGLAREHGTYPVILISIAFFYVVFAIEHGGPKEIAINVVIASLFSVAAIVGYLRSLVVIAFALIVHGLFDGLYLISHTNPSPEW